MKNYVITGGTGTIEDNSKALSRALFRGDLQDSQIRSLPSLNLYLALKNIGLESCQDILNTLTKNQYRAILDFEFWTKDSFREDRFWSWLDSIDDPKDLVPLQRCINSIDPDLLSIIIKRYVEVVFHEEKDDLPPGPNFYSPDKGYTWISFKTHDPDRHRLIGKLFAFLYQTNANAFYQLLAESGEGTSLEFEERAFNERSARLTNEYIPSLDNSAEVHVPYSLEQIKTELQDINDKKIVITPDNYPVVPLFHSACEFQPLRTILEQLPEQRLFEIQSELSYVLNSAVVFFIGDFAEEISLKRITEKVLGSVNTGLQLFENGKTDINTISAVSNLPLVRFYQLGLKELFSIRKKAQKIPADILATLEHMNPALSFLIETLSNPFPLLPAFFREDGSFEIEDDEKLSTELKPFSSLEQIKSCSKILSEQIEEKFSEIRNYERGSQKHNATKQSATKDMQ